MLSGYALLQRVEKAPLLVFLATGNFPVSRRLPAYAGYSGRRKFSCSLSEVILFVGSRTTIRSSQLLKILNRLNPKITCYAYYLPAEINAELPQRLTR